jgi:hypothetical protein
LLRLRNGIRRPISGADDSVGETNVVGLKPETASYGLEFSAVDDSELIIGPRQLRIGAAGSHQLFNWRMNFAARRKKSYDGP